MLTSAAHLGVGVRDESEGWIEEPPPSKAQREWTEAGGLQRPKR